MKRDMEFCLSVFRDRSSDSIAMHSHTCHDNKPVEGYSKETVSGRDGFFTVDFTFSFFTFRKCIDPYAVSFYIIVRLEAVLLLIYKYINVLRF